MYVWMVVCGHKCALKCINIEALLSLLLLLLLYYNYLIINFICVQDGESQARELAHPQSTCIRCGTWWRIGRDDAFRPENRGFESRSYRHIGTLGTSFTYSCLQRFGV